VNGVVSNILLGNADSQFQIAWRLNSKLYPKVYALFTDWHFTFQGNNAISLTGQLLGPVLALVEP
jgi:hypothetical protein